MPKAISEETKQKIAYLSEQENLSEAMIAQAVGVSERTVRRYKKMDGLDRPRPDNNGKASPAVVRPSPHCPDKALEPTERSRPDNTGQYHSDNRRQCKHCGYTTDKKIKGACPGCGSGPFDSISVKIGSPEYEQFIEEIKKLRASEEQKILKERTENEEICDMTKDYWACQDCDFCSNNEFKICPECESRDVIFAPDGREPRDPSKYKDSEPQDNKDSDPQDHEESGDDNETNTKAIEEQQQEFEWECPKCHKEFNGVLENCPHCGIPLMDVRECPRCHHEWYGSPDRCPKCGAELQE
jgi:RNA polymerase subunit RPABC4/transcription elongation factor Spt4